jgi:hypothetical protein
MTTGEDVPRAAPARSFATVDLSGPDRDLAGALAYLADPEKPAAGVHGPAGREAVLALAEPHGVDAILWRKFGGGHDGPGGREMLHRIGQAMLLDRFRHDITRALAAGGVGLSVVKGPVFAERLYPVRGDRLFTDIDLMVEDGAMGKAIAVMAEFGYRRCDGPESGLRRSKEYKFTHPAHRNVLIELHGDMVHYPLLRRRAAFGRRELLRAGDGDGEAPGALLATAIVHATLGHKFERLIMLVDVLQAARRLPAADHRRFADTLAAMRLGLECAVCLNVTAGLFEDGAARELAGRFRSGLRSRAGRLLVTPRSVIAVKEKSPRASWLRRKAFRLLQYLP